jgi:WD40 repeat protein
VGENGPLGGLRSAVLVTVTGTFAVIDDDGRIRVFPFGRPDAARYFRGADMGLRGVATIRSGGVVVMVGTEGAAHLWHRRSRRMQTVVDEGYPITALAISPDETRIAVCDERQRVGVYDIVDGSLVRRWRSMSPDAVSAIAFRPDGKRLATAGAAVRTWQASDGGEARPLPECLWPARTLAYDQQGRRLAGAGRNGAVRVWDGNKLRQTLTGHRGPVLALAFGPAGGELDGHLITAGSDETIRIWDLSAGEEKACLANLGFRPRTLAVNPLGQVGVPASDLVAVGCADGSVRLCRPHNWKDAPALTGHVHEITAMCFTGTGATGRLVTASRDGSARVWRLGVRQAELMLVPGADGWAAAEAQANGTVHAYGETENRIWRAAAFTREFL